MLGLRVLSVAFSGIAVVAAAAAQPARSSVSPPPWCQPSDDPFARRFLSQMLRLATSDDSGPAALRASLRNMPKADTSAVWLVTDDSLCHRASMSLDSGFYTSPHGYPLYLARVEGRYAAFPPSESTVGYWVHMDSRFHVIRVTKN